jgi:hypothetical protein
MICLMMAGWTKYTNDEKGLVHWDGVGCGKKVRLAGTVVEAFPLHVIPLDAA